MSSSSVPRLSWAGSSLLARGLLTVAAVLAVFAVAAGVSAFRTHPTHTVREVAGPVAVAVDAAGCPLQVACRAGSTAPEAMLAAIAKAYPASTVLTVTGTYDRTTGAPYRVTVLAQVGADATVQVLAQRLPGGPVNDPPTVNHADRTHTDLAGNAVVDSRTLFQTVPGRPGCSVLLTLHSEGSKDLYSRGALALGRDPNVQLAP